jgi:CDP-diacylglycerol--serine O-phosphatidyltransferase
VKYFWPNAVTALSLALSVISVEQAVRGRPIDAAWWGLVCVLTDKLDGLVASALKAQSQFGMQLDSLADLFSFGVVPATVLFAFFDARPELGWSRAPLTAICCAYVIACALRLARFNVATRAPHYLGVPSTMTAGTLLTCMLAVLKYADPALVRPESLDAPWMALRTDALVPFLPGAFLVGAGGMLSPLRVPRIGRTRHLATTILLGAALAVGVVLGFARRAPEYLFAGGVTWLAVAAVYHLRTR